MRVRITARPVIGDRSDVVQLSSNQTGYVGEGCLDSIKGSFHIDI